MGTDRKKLSEVNAGYIADIEKKIEFYKNDTGNQLSSYYIKSYEAQIEKLKKQSDIWTMSSLDNTLAD